MLAEVLTCRFKSLQMWQLCLGLAGQSEIQHLPGVPKVESDWKLEIQLDGGTLVLSAKSVFDVNVDLSCNREGSAEHHREINNPLLEWADTQWGTIWMDAVSQSAVKRSSKCLFPSSLAGRSEEHTAGCAGALLSFHLPSVCVIKFAPAFNYLKKSELQSDLHSLYYYKLAAAWNTANKSLIFAGEYWQYKKVHLIVS